MKRDESILELVFDGKEGEEKEAYMGGKRGIHGRFPFRR